MRRCLWMMSETRKCCKKWKMAAATRGKQGCIGEPKYFAMSQKVLATGLELEQVQVQVPWAARPHQNNHLRTWSEKVAQRTEYFRFIISALRQKIAQKSHFRLWEDLPDHTLCTSHPVHVKKRMVPQIPWTSLERTIDRNKE